ncbi:MAG: hypothetical protein V4724_06370 [Pseudomonadota bacterium]
MSTLDASRPQLPVPDAEARLDAPCAVPGRRAPHARLHGDSSLFDHFGQGFTLLLSGAVDGGAGEACAAAARHGVQLKILYSGNADVQALYRHPLTLIGPDRYIAWVGNCWPDPAVDDVFLMLDSPGVAPAMAANGH